MNTTTKTPTGTIVRLMQCAKQRCGHVLLDDEREWIPVSRDGRTKSAVCPKCHGNAFYTLNAQGQARTRRGEGPQEIIAEDIQPSSRMGLKMKRRLYAAKNRALGIPSNSSL